MAAFHRRLKLPTLKVTQRFPGGEESKDLHRGATDAEWVVPDTNQRVNSQDEADCNQLQQQSSSDPSSTIANPEDLFYTGLQDPDFNSLEEPSHHELQSKASICAWEALRSKFLSAVVESSAMPEEQTCLSCDNPAEFRCQRCGPVSFYCYACYKSHHKSTNIFHVAERWEVSNFI